MHMYKHSNRSKSRLIFGLDGSNGDKLKFGGLKAGPRRLDIVDLDGQPPALRQDLDVSVEDPALALRLQAQGALLVERVVALSAKYRVIL